MLNTYPHPSCLCSKSPTGVDWFILDTDNGAAVRVHRSVDYWAKHIVDQIKNIHGTRVVSGAEVGIP